MRKLLVKLFNLIYLAGAGVAIWAFVAKPIVDTKVGISLTSDQVADKLYEMFNKDSGGGSGGGESTEASYKLSYRDSSSESESKVTREDIKAAFPDGFKLEVGVKIEAKDAFNIQNKELLRKSIADSIDKSLSSVVGSVTDGLHSLIKTVTEKLAKDELAKQINAQIAQYFQGASEVTEEEVQAVYDNVYNTINQEGDVTVENLATAIVGEADDDGNYPEGTLLYLLEEKKKETGTGLIYTAADPQPTAEDLATDMEKPEAERIYYVQRPDDNPETPDVEEVKYILPTEYLLETYYVQKYDATTVSGDDIADKLAESLNSIPGLVEEKRNPSSPSKEEFDATVVSSRHYYSPEGVNAKTFVLGGVFDLAKTYYTIDKAEPQPEQETIEAELEMASALRNYVVKTSEGYAFPETASTEVEYYQLTPSLVTSEEYYNSAASNKYKVQTSPDQYEFAKIYDESAEYFIETKIVNDVDTALAKLIEQMLGGGSSSEGGESKAHYRAEGDSSSKSKEELEQAIKDYLYKLIPLDQIYKFTDQADQYSTYVALGVIALCIFPWALFALVTLIRTFRRRKCWTKPWIVFFFAFLQLIFGVVLTYGTTYAMPLIAKYVPQVAQFLEQTQLGLDIRTGCLIPSFIYLGFIVLTIPYAIIAHRLKVEWKLAKRAKAIERYNARRAQ